MSLGPSKAADVERHASFETFKFHRCTNEEAEFRNAEVAAAVSLFQRQIHLAGRITAVPRFCFRSFVLPCAGWETCTYGVRSIRCATFLLLFACFADNPQSFVKRLRFVSINAKNKSVFLILCVAEQVRV